MNPNVSVVCNQICIRSHCHQGVISHVLEGWVTLLLTFYHFWRAILPLYMFSIVQKEITDQCKMYLRCGWYHFVFYLSLEMESIWTAEQWSKPDKYSGFYHFSCGFHFAAYGNLTMMLLSFYLCSNVWKPQEKCSYVHWVLCITGLAPSKPYCLRLS